MFAFNLKYNTTCLPYVLIVTSFTLFFFLLESSWPLPFLFPYLDFFLAKVHFRHSVFPPLNILLQAVCHCYSVPWTVSLVKKKKSSWKTLLTYKSIHSYMGLISLTSVELILIFINEYETSAKFQKAWHISLLLVHITLGVEEYNTSQSIFENLAPMGTFRWKCMCGVQHHRPVFCAENNMQAVGIFTTKKPQCQKPAPEKSGAMHVAAVCNPQNWSLDGMLWLPAWLCAPGSMHQIATAGTPGSPQDPR